MTAERVNKIKRMLRGRLTDKDYEATVELIEDLGQSVSDLIDERDRLEERVEELCSVRGIL